MHKASSLFFTKSIQQLGTVRPHTQQIERETTNGERETRQLLGRDFS